MFHCSSSKSQNLSFSHNSSSPASNSNYKINKPFSIEVSSLIWTLSRWICQTLFSLSTSEWSKSVSSSSRRPTDRSRRRFPDWTTSQIKNWNNNNVVWYCCCDLLFFITNQLVFSIFVFFLRVSTAPRVVHYLMQFRLPKRVERVEPVHDVPRAGRCEKERESVWRKSEERDFQAKRRRERERCQSIQ